MVPAIGVDHPMVEGNTERPPNILPVSATVPMPSQIVSVSSSGPELETPPTVSIILRSRSFESSLITAHLADVSTHY